MDLKDDYIVLKVKDCEKFAGSKKIVCDVCGYTNEEGSLLCKMCSNYLTKEDK